MYGTASGQSTISTETLLHQPYSFRLPFTAIALTTLLGCLVLMRWTCVVYPYEFNPDESQWLSQGMKFFQDPRPWQGVDPTTSGPLNSYPISILLWMGFKPTYILAHALALALACLQVSLSYLSFLRLGSRIAALLGTISIVLFYGDTLNPEFLHYSSELFPVLFLIAGFYCFLLWTQGFPSNSKSHRQPLLLLLCGLALGTTPWFKLQATPIVASLGLIILSSSLFLGRRSLSLRQQTLQIIALCAGTLLPTMVMIAAVLKCGSFKDFWNSYILESVIWAGPFSVKHLATQCIFVFSQPHSQQLLKVFGLALFLFSLCVLVSKEKRLPSPLHRWIFAGLIAYTAAALFAVCRPMYSFSHHVQFLIFPVTCLAVVLASHSIDWLIREEPGSGEPRTMLISIFLLGALSVYSLQQAGFMQAVVQNHEVQSSDTKLIANVVGILQKNHPVKSLAIWGWTPGVYVLTGIPPATRDAIPGYAISQGPLQPYFRQRFLADLRNAQPDLFIDSTVPGAFLWIGWTYDVRYETDPELKKFIQENYTLVGQLTLVKGERPVRFFAKRAVTATQ